LDVLITIKQGIEDLKGMKIVQDDGSRLKRNFEKGGKIMLD
jgi:hypothetical protein